MNVREAAKALLDRLDDRCGPDPVWKQQMDALRTALAADTVEVPREPTPQMIRAGSIAHVNGYPVWIYMTGEATTMEHVVAAYRAMIAAAEQAEGGE